MRVRRLWGGWGLLGAWLVLPAVGQGTLAPLPTLGDGSGAGVPGPVDTMPANTAALLASMASRAAVIFTGTVADVVRHDDLGYVEIRFNIETSLRGPSGTVYMLREWAGLWSGQTERYRAGQHRLMLLTAPGASGLSAPVEGLEGAIPLVPAGGPAMEGAPASACDLRWIEARALRPAAPFGAWQVQAGGSQNQADAGAAKSEGASPLPGQAASANPWAGPVEPFSGSATGASMTARVSLKSVAALLRASLSGVKP